MLSHEIVDESGLEVGVGLTIFFSVLTIAAIVLAKGRKLIYVLLIWSTSIASLEHLIPAMLGERVRVFGFPPHIVITLASLISFFYLIIFGNASEIYKKYKSRWVSAYILFIIFCVPETMRSVLWQDVDAGGISLAIRDLVFQIGPVSAYIVFVSALASSPVCAKEFLNRIVPASIILVVAFSILSLALGRPVFGSDYLGTVRFMGGMGWSGMAYLSLILCLVGVARVAELPRITLTDMIFITTAFGGLVISLSRTAFLAFAVAFLAMLIVWRGSPRRRLIGYYLTFFSAIPASYFIVPAVIDRSFSASGEFMTSGRARAAAYMSDMLAGRENIVTYLFGHGLGTARAITEDLARFGAEVRSVYVVLYYDVGLIGVLFYVMIELVMVIEAYSTYRMVLRATYDGVEQTRALALAGVGAAVSLVVIGLFDNLTFVSLFSLYFFVVGAAKVHYLLQGRDASGMAPTGSPLT